MLAQPNHYFYLDYNVLLKKKKKTLRSQNIKLNYFVPNHYVNVYN